MAINLDAGKAISLNDAVTSQELNAAVDTSSYKRMGTSEQEKISSEKAAKSKKKKNIADSVIYAAKNDNKQAKRRKKKARKAREKQIAESQERAAQGAKVRKYTKEMQNRDAVIRKSRSMRKKAAMTASALDDKFAIAAMAPTKRFDCIIYNSATPDDASELLDDVFEAIMNDSE